MLTLDLHTHMCTHTYIIQLHIQCIHTMHTTHMPYTQNAQNIQHILYIQYVQHTQHIHNKHMAYAINTTHTQLIKKPWKQRSGDGSGFLPPPCFYWLNPCCSICLLRPSIEPPWRTPPAQKDTCQEEQCPATRLTQLGIRGKV